MGTGPQKKKKIEVKKLQKFQREMRTIKDHDLCGAMRELLVQAEERKTLERT